MEKLKMHTPDITKGHIEKIRDQFPNCVTEASDESGEIRYAVDFDQLRQELSDYIVEGPQERYQLNWPGKLEALFVANAPIAKTLRPCRDESVNFDSTKNLFIEGDNLDALKLLQETYLGKVKMIYIDPPYNKGKDFVYRDIFSVSNEEYFKSSQQVSDTGDRLIANPESNGRYHSSWLSMMYPRLKLARTLLRDDGVLFVSIDENEIDNLEKICKEVFGHSNVLGHFPVIMNLKGNQDAFGFAETHEYFLVCMKSKDACSLYRFDVDEEELLKDWKEDEYGLYKEADNLRATGVNAPRERRPNLYYPIFVNPDTHEFYINENDQPLAETDEIVWPINPEGDELSWYWSRQTFESSKHNLILKETSNGWQFYRKQRPALGDLPTKKPKSFFYKPEYSTSTATTHLKNLMGAKVFDGPKPVPFLSDLLTIGSQDGDVVLDFFAGTGTTGHAAMSLAAASGENRQYILVQCPEVVEPETVAARAGFATISEIAKERLRRAGSEILASTKHESWNRDIGFRVLKVDTSNMADVYYTPGEVKQDDLLGAVDNIKPGRDDPEDLLFQVLVDWGVELSLPIRSETIQDKAVFFVNEEPYDLIACFNTEITEDLVKELAKYQPMRVVFRDNGFVSDAVKINVDQIFHQLSPATDVRSI